MVSKISIRSWSLKWSLKFNYILLLIFTGCGEYYNHAVANIKLIGVMLAHLILLLNVIMQVKNKTKSLKQQLISIYSKLLQNKLNVSFDNCHLVGHSLGKSSEFLLNIFVLILMLSFFFRCSFGWLHRTVFT